MASDANAIKPRQLLSVTDGVFLTAGMIIGALIFKAPRRFGFQSIAQSPLGFARNIVTRAQPKGQRSACRHRFSSQNTALRTTLIRIEVVIGM